MSGWNVDPAGVERVLTDVAHQGTVISDALGGSADGRTQGIDKISATAVTAAQSQVIGDAIVAFFDHEKPVLTGITNRIKASLMGASKATQEIVDGDEAMAASTQAKAVAAAASGDFSALGGR
ncbi:DUF6507 family protein [Sinomonas sp. G460-2]|uniref:DUF6507 family protein n=1 Tax=Sinomonas sp. G460-2 TaxID=3393464 RepID=UPI0039EEFE13